jgi:molybdopterin converting factor small subunit
LRKHLGARVIEIEVPEESTIGTVIDRVIELGGPSVEKLILDNTSVSGNLIILLNKRDIDALDGQDTIVHEDDEVTLLPHVQGG